jgi:hypothetical protein
MNRNKHPRRRQPLPWMYLLAAVALTILWGLSDDVLAQSQWTTNGNNINNTNSGNVGVGTTTPNAKLVVTGGNVGLGSNDIESWTGASSVIESTNTSIFFGQVADIHLLSNAYNNSGWKYKGTGPAANYYLYNGVHGWRVAASGTIDTAVTWTDAMTLNNSGNLGIGTTTPNQTLTVSGYNYSGFGTSVQIIGAAGSGTLQNQFNITSAANTWGLILGQNNSGVATNGYHCAGCAHIVNFNNASLVLGTNNTARLAVTGAGNVGIGTLSPSYKLDIQGGQVNASGGLCIAGDCKTSWSQVGGSSQWTTSGSNISYSTGNVGIGTTSPSTPLHVLSNNANVLVGNIGANYGAIGFQNTLNVNNYALTGSAAETVLNTPAGTSLSLRVNNSLTNTLVLNSSGNVGIGTTTPSEKLDVVGNVNASGTITGGNIVAKYQDVAEWVPARQQMSAGTVVVLDTEQSNQVTTSKQPYDTRVAGVVSAQPGVILGEAGEHKAMIATTGRVKVKVDATRSPIKLGDLLVTSDREGMAMKSEPLMIQGRPFHSPGTLIGKALESLEKGTGEILVLLSLQ